MPTSSPISAEDDASQQRLLLSKGWVVVPPQHPLKVTAKTRKWKKVGTNCTMRQDQAVAYESRSAERIEF